MNPPPFRPFRAIALAGLTCGVMDITAAFITWGIKGIAPARILRGIAAGLLGPASFRGGWRTAALGLAIHFFIAFCAATVFYLASRKLRFMTRRPVLSGALYGIAVYLVMYWIVMPLIHTPRKTLSQSIVAILTHIVCVGLPISLLIRALSPLRTISSPPHSVAASTYSPAR
jgi:hypothetical protein